jgi:glycosyltransferase involved in cell wall biosynthesis
LVKLAEKYVYKRATIVSANNLVLGKYVAELGGRTDTPSINFPPLDLAHFATQSRREIRTKMGIDQNSFVITYMGSLFTFSGLIQVVSDFASLSEPTDRLVIIGGGEIANELKQKVKELNIEAKVIFTGVINYSDLPDYLSVSDVLINPFESILVTNLALPHKVLQYLATGIPTVSTELSGLFHSLGNKAGIFWVNSPELVIGACMKLKHETLNEKIRSTELGKEFVNHHFSRSATLNSFLSTLMTSTTKHH